MPAIFRRPSIASCFYCQSNLTPSPRDPCNFRCRHCGCWNRYDKNGEIISEEAAMHEEALNTRSFARRASPRKDRLPSLYATTPLCHTCQSNQILLTQLLSNYLPPPEDPSYERHLEKLSEYKRSIELRYPPVCESCAPQVEEAIRKGDQMARIRALGGALKNTKGTDSRRRSSATQKEKDKLERELRMWRLRGCLWVGSLLLASSSYISVAAAYPIFSAPSYLPKALPFVVIISVLWTAWDPTYATSRRAQFQGRAVRVHGKKQYSILQFIAWILRLGATVMVAFSRIKPHYDFVHIWDDPSSRTARAFCSILFACEVLILLYSVLSLKVQYPPPVRLVDTKSHLRHTSATPSGSSSRHATPVVAEPDLLTSLTLSNNPVFPTENPIFGVAAFSTAAPPASPPHKPGAITDRSPGMDVDEDDDERDPDAMDVDTVTPVKRPDRDTDGSWLRPQRFFAPEEPTGLENLFAQTIRLADSHDQGVTNARTVDVRRQPPRRGVDEFVRDWRIWLALAVLPLSAVGYKAWDAHMQRTI